MKVKKDPKKPGFFLVESASQKDKFYSVDPKKPFCSCPAFRFREMKRHGVCKHIEAVRQKFEEKNKDVFEKIIKHVKKNKEVDSVELIEKFGEEPVNSLIKKGELVEKKGVIRLLE